MVDILLLGDGGGQLDLAVHASQQLTSNTRSHRKALSEVHIVQKGSTQTKISQKQGRTSMLFSALRYGFAKLTGL